MRKLTILTLALLYVFSLAAVSAFAANGARGDNNHARMWPSERMNQPLLETKPGTSSDNGSKADVSHMALGYLMTGISPGILLGSTSYDLQHNMRMARQVEVGADNRVHFIWTAAPFPFDANSRAVQYSSYRNGVLDESYSLSGFLDKSPGRFCSIDVYASRALVSYHYTNAGNNLTTSALDIASAGGNFATVDPRSDTVNCEGIIAGGGTTVAPYIWPVVAADQDGTGKLVVHIAASEGNTAGGSWSAIAYYRGVGASLTAPMVPGLYGTCGMFVDSCEATGYDIAASPYNNDVVIAYPKARQANRENNDLAYRLSTDMGASWGPIVNVTKYDPKASTRCSGDLSVLFTSDGYFHILYVENNYDSATSTDNEQCKLKQWSSQYPNNTSMVLDANEIDANCNTASFEYNVAKVTLTQCHSTSLAKDLLYAVYSRQLGTTADPDCSHLLYHNQEVFMSPSSTMGETWGAPVNLTNTKTNDCLAGACADDGSTSSARYVTDSLRIEYLEDLDAGSAVGNDATTSELDPVKFLTYSCIDMAPYRVLTCTPSAIKYPFHAAKNAFATQELTLVNGGNQSIDWTSALVGSGVTVSLLPASGSVPAGYTNSATVTAKVGTKSSEGLFHNTIRFTYDSGTKTFDVPIDFYVFDSWFLPQDVAIRTANNKMLVNQAGQAASDYTGSSFSYFVTGGEDFITDASLIMGNSVDNLSWLIFKNGQGEPTDANNFGRLYALSNTTYDTTTFQSYRVAYGKGTNRDSTVGFDVNWYAAKFVDSADFYVGHFEVYKGKNNPTGTVPGLDIAFGCDWDVPSDTSSDNSIGYDSLRQMIYLQGEYSAAREFGYAASAAYLEKTVSPDSADADETLQPIAGGFAWGNQQQVYGQQGYVVDSVWKYMQAVDSPHPYSSLWLTGDSIGDMSIVMVVAKNYTVTPTSRLKFDIVLAAKRAQTNLDGLAGLNLAVDQARALISNRGRCSACGDANSDGSVDISDVVYLIAHIFSGGTSPRWCDYPKGKGDANGDHQVDISDAVYLIARIFSGGKAPHCQGT